MIKMNYSIDTEKKCLTIENKISGQSKSLKIELGMIIFYLIENKQIDKTTIDKLTDVVNEAVNSGLTGDDILSMFFEEAYGINLDKKRKR